MKILKWILIVLVAIIVLPLVIALFTKKEYIVEREITINKPKQEVFDYIKFIKNQDQYSKWNQIDPAMKKEYTGTDGTVGFVYSWDSKVESAGKGSQEIKKIIDGERLEMALHFIKPMEGLADAHMTTEAVSPTATKVKWGVAGKMNWPMNIFLLCMNMDKMLGADIQVGLDNLKVVLEKK